MATKPDCLHRTSWLYHFTDARNIPLIWELDGLWSTAKLREMGVDFHAGGNQHSLNADQMFGMDQYVHLCFTKEHPMAHIAKNDGRIEKLQWISDLQHEHSRPVPGALVYAGYGEALSAAGEEAARLFKHCDLQ
jgi:hypothetical protein